MIWEYAQKYAINLNVLLIKIRVVMAISWWQKRYVRQKNYKMALDYHLFS
jgi:hypothetical protein